jgi:hypothetical protein
MMKLSGIGRFNVATVVVLSKGPSLDWQKSAEEATIIHLY